MMKSKKVLVDQISPKRKVLVDADSLCYAAGFKKDVYAARGSLEERVQEIRENCKSEDLELYIESWEGKNLTRAEYAVTKPYKGNRSGQEKPTYLIECKEHLVKHMGGVVVDKRYESEDMCLIRATEEGRDNCIIAFIDKDLLQAPFDYYNYQKKEFISLTEKQAEINLYRQILTGDRTDNISGLFKVGPKTAEKIVTEETVNIPLAVATMYKEKGHTYDYLVEQSRLIYLIRQHDEVFDFPVSKEEYEEIKIEKEVV